MLHWFIYTVAFLIVWTLVSIGWLFRNLGDKHSNEKAPWWEWIIAAPVLVISSVVGFIYSRYS